MEDNNLQMPQRKCAIAECREFTHNALYCGSCAEQLESNGLFATRVKDRRVILPRVSTDRNNLPTVAKNIRYAAAFINTYNEEVGWWTNLQTGESLLTEVEGEYKRDIPEALCLIHSEVSEAMEGYRKNLPDDHLPHRSMLEVELADAVIRILDLGCGLGLDIGGALAEKVAYNMNRADHKKENRLTENGKKF